LKNIASFTVLSYVSPSIFFPFCPLLESMAFYWETRAQSTIPPPPLFFPSTVFGRCIDIVYMPPFFQITPYSFPLFPFPSAVVCFAAFRQVVFHKLGHVAPFFSPDRFPLNPIVTITLFIKAFPHSARSSNGVCPTLTVIVDSAFLPVL